MTVETLILRLDADAATARWAVFDADGRLMSAPAAGPLGDAVEPARGRRLVVLVPGLDVVTTETALPNLGAARLRKMLPYSLEDTLAEDVDNLFFAVGPRGPEGAVAVAVVARDHLERWLAALAAAGLLPQAVYADADGVPDTPGTLTLLMEGERIYGRAPGRPPFVFESLPLAGLLDTLQADEKTPEYGHVVVYLDAEAQQLHEHDLRALPERVSSTDVKLMADSAWCRLAATLTHSPGINLLQGPYAPKSNWAAAVRPWRLAAGLVLAAALLGFVGRGAEYLALRHEDNALTAVLAADCRRSLGAAELRRCEAEVRRRLGANAAQADAGGPSFLGALAAVAASENPKSRIEALSYRNQVLDLQLVVPDVAALNTFVEDVQRSKRFAVRIQSTNPGKDGVEGRVRVLGAGR